MGVQDLMKLIRSKCADALHSSATRAVTGAVWIDTPLLVMAAAKKAEADGHDPKEAVKQSIRRMHSMVSCLSPESIHWVFDGKTRTEKVGTVQQRVQASAKFTHSCVKKAVDRHVEAMVPEDDDSLERDLETASTIVCIVQQPSGPSISQIFDHAKACAAKTGGIVHFARHDSEDFIARNMKEGDVAITSDSDALPFGCPWVVQHFGSPAETWIVLEDVLQSLHLTLEQFRLLCVLLGNDFNTRLFRCGPAKCFSALQSPTFSLESFAKANGGDEAWLRSARATLDIFCGKVVSQECGDGVV